MGLAAWAQLGPVVFRRKTTVSKQKKGKQMLHKVRIKKYGDDSGGEYSQEMTLN